MIDLLILVLLLVVVMVAGDIFSIKETLSHQNDAPVHLVADVGILRRIRHLFIIKGKFRPFLVQCVLLCITLHRDE